MTEESVETLYLLGLQDRIVGVSGFVKRPAQARKKPVISAFTHANLKRIQELKPDLVLGFSDIQKDIARDLIGAGMEVWIANHRTLEGILEYVQRLAGFLGHQQQGEELVSRLRACVRKAELEAATFRIRPRVYFEEWPDPQISAIGWVSDLIELCGGQNIFKNKAHSSLAADRIVTLEEIVEASPELFLACWCGRRFDPQNLKERFAQSSVPALLDQQIFDCEPEVFLQPGPAAILDGIPWMLKRIRSLQ